MRASLASVTALAALAIAASVTPARAQDAPPPPAPTDPAPSTDGKPGNDARAGVPGTVAGSEAAAAIPERSIDRQRSRSMIQEDLLPTVQVLKNDQVEIRAGGLMQLYLAPWAGDESIIASGDPVTRAGFRLRRAFFGVEGRIGDKFGVLISVNPVTVDPDTGAVGDAKVFYALDTAFRLSAGTTKIAFSRGTLETSRALTGLERPLSSTTITPGRRLGATAEGELFKGRVGYLLSGSNGTEGFAQGNQFGGFMGAGRLELRLGDMPNPWKKQNGAVVAVNAFGLVAPATTAIGYGADVYGSVAGAHAKLEGLCDRTRPKDAPTVPSTLPDVVQRCGVYGELGYVIDIPVVPLQPVIRAELFDDNTGVADAGDLLLIDAGINAPLYKEVLRAQARYVARIEQKGESRSNDAFVLSLQGAF